LVKEIVTGSLIKLPFSSTKLSLGIVIFDPFDVRITFSSPGITTNDSVGKLTFLKGEITTDFG